MLKKVSKRESLAAENLRNGTASKEDAEIILQKAEEVLNKVISALNIVDDNFKKMGIDV